MPPARSLTWGQAGTARWATAGFCLLLPLHPAAAGTPANGTAAYEPPAVRSRDGVSFVEQGGVRVTLGFQRRAADEARDGTGPSAGEPILMSLLVADAASGTPLRGLRPRGWLALRKPGAGDPSGEECLGMIRRFGSGRLSAAAEVDLNQFHVYALNSDRTVTIFNPLVSFSRTRMLGIAQLPAAGADWALTPSRSELLVTLPERGSVARLDTHRRRLIGEIPVGGRPGRILVPREDSTAWIGDDSAGSIVVIDLRTPAITSRLPVGVGPILLAPAPEAGAVVAASSNRLSLADARGRAERWSVELPEPPVALGVSDLAGAAFVASTGSGKVRVHDMASGSLRAEAQLQPGLSDLAVTPDGRWALAANLRTGGVDVLDTATAALIRSFDVGSEPDRIVFSSAFAYIRSRNTADVSLIQWPALGSPGSLPVVRVPLGRSAHGGPVPPPAAASIDAVPGRGAVVAANRGDRTLYYYTEGMMAPMGSMQNASREPVALMVVDGSLRETDPGLYATGVVLQEGGVYDVPFYLENPRIAGCFQVAVAGGGTTRARGGRPALEAAFVAPPGEARAGSPVSLAFRLSDRETGAPSSGLSGVGILTFRPPGLFQARLDARETREGVYGGVVTYPAAGEYVVMVSCPSRGLEYGDVPLVRVTVAGSGAGPDPGGGGP